MDRELEKIPGALWNFSQPIADNMEEAVSGVKGRARHQDLRRRSEDAGSEGRRDRQRHAHHPRHRGPRPVPRDRPAESEFRRGPRSRRRAIRSTSPTCRTPSKPRWAARPSARCCKASSATTWWCAIRRPTANTKEAIENIRLLAPSGERVSLAQLCNVQVLDGASEIYREGNSRYVAIKYSVRGRDLGSTVEEAISKVNAQVKLPTGYHIDWAGEYESQKRSQRRLMIVLPITMLVICIILYTMFNSVQVGAADSGQRRHGAHRRPAGAADHRHALQRLFGRRIPGAVRRLGADRRHHAGIHQPASRARLHRSGGAPWKEPCCGCGPS